MEAFEALKEENDFGPATYWNRPTGGLMPRVSKYASLKNKVAHRKGKITPPPSGSRTTSPTPSLQSKTPNLVLSATHTRTAEENDSRDEKALHKIMKSKLPQFSDETDWEAAIFELKLILDRVWPHKEELDIIEYMTDSCYRKSLSADMESRADNLIYYALTMSATKNSYAKLQILSASHRNAIPCVMVNEGKKLFQLFEGQFTMTNLHQASLPTVRVEFYAITQGDKETVLAYTSRVDIIVATLAKLGERVSTGAWIYALGNGLRAEYKESKDGILYNKPGFDSVISVKTILLSEEAVLTSKNKKANDTIKATKEKDDEIALKLKELKISTDKKLKEPKEPTDKSLYIKGKGGKGDMKGKGGTKGRNINESSPWPTPWNSPEGSSTTHYANWHPPAKGKGYVKPNVDPSLLWCDIHHTHGHSTDWCFENPYRTGGPPLPNSRPWCDSCHSHGHTSDTCWANSPRSQTPKGKGKPQNQKGKGG